MQPDLFSSPVLHDVKTTSATVESLPPFRGSTPQSAHASWTGARHAEETRSANITALRQLWREPRTINEIAAITGLPISSVCSLKSAIADELEVADFEMIEWGDGRKSTKRCRWQLKARREVSVMAEDTEDTRSGDELTDAEKDAKADAESAGEKTGEAEQKTE